MLCARSGAAGEGDGIESIAALVVIASEAKQSIAPQSKSGLLRRFAPRNDGIDRQRLASASITSPAALSPLSLAPCAVEKKCGEVASPAKNSRPSTGAASAARSPAWPGSAWE